MFELIANPETGRVHRAVRDKEGNVTVQEKPASSRYRITDPHELKAKLDPYFEVRELQSYITLRMEKGTINSPFAAGLLVVERHESFEGYKRMARLICTHTGRHKFFLQPGAKRHACDNSFYTPRGAEQYSWRHNSRDLDQFLADPVPIVYNAMEQSLSPARRCEQLRGFTGGAPQLLNAVCVARPRLGSDALDRLAEYQEGELSLWAVLQAFTGTHNATLEGLAALALGPGFDELRRGQVPACVERALR